MTSWKFLTWPSALVLMGLPRPSDDLWPEEDGNHSTNSPGPHTELRKHSPECLSIWLTILCIKPPGQQRSRSVAWERGVSLWYALGSQCSPNVLLRSKVQEGSAAIDDTPWAWAQAQGPGGHEQAAYLVLLQSLLSLACGWQGWDAVCLAHLAEGE